MSDVTTAPAAAEVHLSPAADDAARNRLVISLLLVSAFIVILNETIMGVALPDLMDDLRITASAGQWLTTAFMLTMAVVIPVTGFLLQRLNTRPVFALAMSLFSIGTLICAVAPGFEVLVAGRVVQASGTAIMMPLLMTTVMTLVEPQNRGRIMGNISIVISVAPAIGPTISGLILSVLDWRFLFILVLPIAIGGLALGLARIRNVSTPRYAPLDIVSVILSVPGFGGLVYGLSALGEGAGHGPVVEGAAHAAPVVPAWVALLIGVVALVLFVLRQLSLQKVDKALLDLRTFTSRTFTISTLMMAVAMMALFGSLILLPIFMQKVLGLNVLQSGLLLLPGGLVMGLLAPFVGRLYDRHGPTVLLVPGSILVGVVFWGMTLLNQDTHYLWLLAAHVTMSVGLALIFTPLFTSSLGSLPPHLYSHGSAMVGTVQQVAGGVGTALFVALMTLGSASLAAGGASEVVALAGGIHNAFIAAALIWTPSVIIAFFVRKPKNAAPGMVGGH